MAISSDVIRGYNDTMILYLLLDKPSYGYEISKQIKTLSNEKYVIICMIFTCFAVILRA